MGYKKGFTLIELLIAIGIAVILAAMVIVAINPVRQMEEARNKRREAHVNVLYGALQEYKSREGSYPSCVSSTSTDVINCQSALTPDYIYELPVDPNGCDCSTDTGYLIKESTTGRVGVSAKCAEAGATITAGKWN